MIILTNRYAGYALICGLTLAGCSSRATEPAAQKAPESRVPAKEYPMRGEITGLDTAQHVATIKHDDIPGLMGAMTMGYPIRDPAEFAKLSTGEMITATVFVQGDEMWVGKIKAAGAP